MIRRAVCLLLAVQLLLLQGLLCPHCPALDSSSGRGQAHLHARSLTWNNSREADQSCACCRRLEPRSASSAQAASSPEVSEVLPPSRLEDSFFLSCSWVAAWTAHPEGLLALLAELPPLTFDDFFLPNRCPWGALPLPPLAAPACPLYLLQVTLLI